MPSTPSSSPDSRFRPRRLLLLAVGIALVAGVVVLATAGDDSESTKLAHCGDAARDSVERIDVGDTVPDFTLPSLDGSCVRVTRYRGRPLVINFWASWCTPCRKEFPVFRNALEQNDQLAILGITYRDIVADSRRFAAEQDATWPLLVDGDGEVAKLFHVGLIPQTFFVDSRGNVRAHLFGDITKKQLAREIRRLLQLA